MKAPDRATRLPAWDNVRSRLRASGSRLNAGDLGLRLHEAQRLVRKLETFGRPAVGIEVNDTRIVVFLQSHGGTGECERIVLRRSTYRRDTSDHVNEPHRISRQAMSLTDIAARIIPADHRERYAEEFRTELYEIAQTSGKAAQVRYAGRVLVRSLSTRAAIRSNRISVKLGIGVGTGGGVSLAFLGGWSGTAGIAILSCAGLGGLAFVVVSAERTERMIQLIRSMRER
jgi:hypothetical protein